MNVETLRFGKITVNDDAIIHFEEGLPGFSKLRSFFLLESNDNQLFLWLQSLDDPRIAFPVIEPQLSSPSYKVPISEKELIQLEETDLKRIKVLCIVTIPENPCDMTANLRAPILISLDHHKAVQVISPDSTYPVKHPIFNDLQRFVSRHLNESPRSPSLEGAEKLAPVEFHIHQLKGPDA